MKIIITIKAVFLIAFVTIVTSCKKNNQYADIGLKKIATQGLSIDSSYLTSKVNSLLKLGYSLDRKLSITDIDCYRLKDTTVFVNKKKILSMQKNKETRVLSFSDTHMATYIMYANESILSGQMMVDASGYIDDNNDAGLDDLAFNSRNYDYVSCEVIGGMRYSDYQSKNSLWGSATGNSVEIRITTDTGIAIGALDNAVDADPNQSLIRIK